MRLPERLAANVAWLFTEHAWLDRFAAAADAGFAQVEFPWPDDPAATAAAVKRAGLRVAMLNAAAGDLAAGERGWPNDESRTSEWRSAFADAVELAVDLGCPTVNVLAGNRVPGRGDHEQLESLEANLRWAIATAAPRGVAVVTELLNPRENAQYLLARVDDVEPLLTELGPIGWRLQLDTWHLALAEPDVPAAIRRATGRIGHVQVADAPGRREPGTGVLDWDAIRAALRDAGYHGPIGLEYRPQAATVDGLADGSALGGWLRA